MKETPLERIVRLARSNDRPGRQVASEAGSKKFGKPIGADITNSPVGRVLSKVSNDYGDLPVRPPGPTSNSPLSGQDHPVNFVNQSTDNSFLENPSITELAKIATVKSRKKDRFLDSLDDVKSVNPKYNDPNSEAPSQHPFRYNCARVVQALELRRRNYDVVAGPSPSGSARKTLIMLAQGWRTQDGKIRVTDFPLTFSQIEQAIALWPDDARGWVGMSFVGGANHIVNIEKLKDKPIYQDGQSGLQFKTTEEFLAYLSSKDIILSGRWTLVRVDDLIPNDEVLKYVHPRDGK